MTRGFAPANPTISRHLPSVDMSPPPLPSLLSLDREQLISWLKSVGESAYRGDQIRRWIFSGRVNSINEMRDLPQKLREKLAESFTLFQAQPVRHLVAKDRTEKLLLELPDGNHIECVLMRETRRRTVCISTQVGCAMGCVFCASGLLGVKRNLTRAEILEQVLRVDRLLGKEEALTNVVIMGIGEPLANLRNLLPALDELCDPRGLGMSPRRITVSTVGLPDGIEELTNHGKAFNLAISLHAPNDALRTRLVPVNKNIGITKILTAAHNFFAKTGRRVTFEYVLLSGVNDGLTEARELGQILSQFNAHVNLIPMNGVSELDFVEPTAPMTRQFVECLEGYGVAATVRKRKGADIDAACGQLRLKQTQAQPVVPLSNP